MKTIGIRLESELVDLKDNEWLEKQRIAGKVVANTLSLLESLVKDKTNKTLLELSKIAEEFILQNKCTPTFKNYKRFPEAVCISIDNNIKNQLVHGIPSDEKLTDGDIVKFDLGATFYGDNKKGAIADSAITCIYGSPTSEKHIKLLNETRTSLILGIQSIKVGFPIGCIGNAIYKYGKSKNYGVITNYGGHGISWDTPHSKPFIANKSDIEDGVRIQNNLSIAIEPMFCLGGTKTWVDNDGWSVNCESISSHWEHSIYVHENKVEIITQRENEQI